MSKELKTIRETIKAKLDGKEVEFRSTEGGEWMLLNTLFISFDVIDDDKHKYEFRIKINKPSIDWSQVSETYRYLARDECGLVWLYENEPTCRNSNWWAKGSDICIRADVFKSLEIGTCDWEDSLVERPKN